jgi:hypothetical protein
VITDQEFGPIFKEKENEPNQPTALRSTPATQQHQQHQSTQLRQKQSPPTKHPTYNYQIDLTNRSIISTTSATFLADLPRRNRVNNTLSGLSTSLSTSAPVASAPSPYHTTISDLPVIALARAFTRRQHDNFSSARGSTDLLAIAFARAFTIRQQRAYNASALFSSPFFHQPLRISTNLRIPSAAASNTSTAASTPQLQPQHFNSGLEHLDRGLDTSTAASTLRWRHHTSTVASNTSMAASHLDSSLEHLDGGFKTSTTASTPRRQPHSSLNTSTAALTPRQQKHLKVEG